MMTWCVASITSSCLCPDAEARILLSVMCEAASPFEKTRSKVTVFGDLAYDAQTSAGYELANSTSGQSDCTLSPSVTGSPSENVQDQLVELFEFTPFGCIEIERRQRNRDQDS